MTLAVGGTSKQGQRQSEKVEKNVDKNQICLILQNIMGKL